MRYNFLKPITIFSAVYLVLAMAACVKSRPGFTDLSDVSDFVYLDNSGRQNFKNANILVNTSSPDAIELTVLAGLASANSNNGPVTITLGLDNSVIAPYNAANGTNFQPFPSDAYKLVSNTITIEGEIKHYGTAKVRIFQNKLDPTVSYLLPVSITNGGGKGLTSNQNTIYFNVIGNPLAGNYSQDFYRWNGTTDTTTAPNSTVFRGRAVTVAPVTATALLLPESYLQTFVGSTAGITLSFTNSNGALSGFSVYLDPTTLAGMASNGFVVVTSPRLVSYRIVGNASTHYAGSSFRTYMVLVNSAGATRTLIDNFVKK